MGEQYGSRQKETANYSQSSSCHHQPTPNPFMVSVKRLRPLADPTPRDSVQSRICCPELFRTRQATPGSSGHVGYSEGNGPPQARQRYLKASSSERKNGDTIAEMRMERPEAEILHRKKERKKAKMIEKRQRQRQRTERERSPDRE